MHTPLFILLYFSAGYCLEVYVRLFYITISVPKTVLTLTVCIDIYADHGRTKVGFIFIGPNSLSRAEDLAAVNHVTKAVVKVESKIES